MSHITSGYCQSSMGIGHPNGDPLTNYCYYCGRNSDQINKREKASLGEGFSHLASVDPIPVNISHQETQELRIKALEFAIKIFGDTIQKYECPVILNSAERFYTYITKGE